ncbi:L-2-deoxyfucosyltransferase/glycosyltransferase DesVII [Murinocardiopsis flavida]|uniref:L-2-deoxyfucosyltransferase/glycosyltransferase DesVII n=1 Tax=Murinocardiopsis flavida TaxID=645275 RepID=A0A2P8C865_9ACTN|nr:nucleotide disphospho-sugar-binding domain-containing protein [Murinocardiopsis flavida]PSK81164.1 L-2-deoxyfucosyltransferase/glycosyltransferase DesVII [Murinocardiopsis flavida]
MRVVLTHHAATAHLNLMVPLGWALKAAGHEVVVAAQPDIMAAVANTGLVGYPVGQEAKIAERLAALPVEETFFGSGFDLTESRPEVLTQEYIRGCLAAFASPQALDLITDESMYDELVDFCRSWKPDLIIWDSITYPGPVAAKACGAAHVRMTIGRDHWARLWEKFTEPKDKTPGFVDPIETWLSEKLERYGLEFDESLILGQATIDMMPEWARFPLRQNCLPIRYIPYNSSATVPEWLISEAPDRPRVCLTMGVSFMEMWGGSTSLALNEMFDSVKDLDLDLICLLDPSLLPDGVSAPDNVRFPGFVPLDFLLKSCSAVIFHGGTGTFGTALANGVPQLIIPTDPRFDERGLAEKVAESGIGLKILPEDFTPSRFREALIRLIGEPSFAENARVKQKDLMDDPRPNHVVHQLEYMAGREKTTNPIASGMAG